MHTRTNPFYPERLRAQPGGKSGRDPVVSKLVFESREPATDQIVISATSATDPDDRTFHTESFKVKLIARAPDDTLIAAPCSAVDAPNSGRKAA